MKDQEIKAILQAHTALLIALASVVPEPERVRQFFEPLISRAIAEEPDAQTAGILQTLEEVYRQVIGQHSKRSG
jgi:hypothetical protein